MRRICVFCGSSSGTRPEYAGAARALAGELVTRRLGGFPKLGDRLPLGQHELTVEEVDGVRVSRLKLTRRMFTGAETGQTGFLKKPE